MACPGLPRNAAAFEGTVADPALGEEVKKSNTDLAPLPGEAMQTMVEDILKSPPALVDRMKDISRVSNRRCVLGAVHSPHAYLDNVGTLHASLDEAKRALGIALMHEARKGITSAPTELDIIWDEPMRARCVVRSFDANGNKGLWMEAAIGQINEMRAEQLR